jgi:hypothetical protein
MIPFPSIEKVVLLDRKAEMARNTSANFHQRFGASVRVFHEEDVACRAVLADTTMLPALAVNDRIGLNEVKKYGASFDVVFRQASPLSLIILFSDSATPEQVKRWLREGKIDLALEKKNPEQLYEAVQGIRSRWDSQPAKKLRAYIATQSHPELPCMSDGTEGVSLVDEHREIVKGTPRGEHCALIWDKVLSELVGA